MYTKRRPGEKVGRRGGSLLTVPAKTKRAGKKIPPFIITYKLWF